MTTKPTKFICPPFLKGKTGKEFAADAKRILRDKPDSYSAGAISDAGETLWDEKLAQGQINTKNARKPRKKDVTQAEILAVKDRYIAQHSFAWGWKSYVMRKLDISRNTLASRLRTKK